MRIFLAYLLGIASGYLSSMSFINVVETYRPTRDSDDNKKENDRSLLLRRYNPEAELVRPFPMPEEGSRYKIFQPLYDLAASSVTVTERNGFIVGPAQDVIERLQERVTWLDSMVTRPPTATVTTNHARLAYLELIKGILSGSAFQAAEYAVIPAMGSRSTIDLKRQLFETKPMDLSLRAVGEDWAYLGDTMTGHVRLDNVRLLLEDVINNQVPGDYIETGVWRGGSSMFARSVIHAYNETSTRRSYVCDSFQGLPPGDRKLHKHDQGWNKNQYLEVSAETVAAGFEKYNLLDPNVIFVKGFFNDTMPPLSKHINKLAVMRLDGDMYESTVDVLYHMYDKLSIGGYVIIDDWTDLPAQDASRDFFAVHGIAPEVVKIDGTATYWKKTQEVELQYWRYQQNKFKP